MTSKLQVTIPKKVADECGIAPGDDIEFVAAGEGLRVVLPRRAGDALVTGDRLALFDRATVRQKARQRGRRPARVRDHGWTRADLYERGRAR